MAAVTEEDFKGGIHAVMGAMLVVMAAYNLMRLSGPSRARRHVINVALYLPGAVYEFWNAKYHWSQQR